MNLQGDKAMKILFLDWDCYGKLDIIAVLRDLGHCVDVLPLDLDTYMGYDYAFIERLSKQIKQNQYQVVFTLNYYPSVSEGCKDTNAKYASWIYDSPYLKLYSANLINPCNFVFTFDKFTYHELSSLSIQTIHYLPLAAHTKRLQQMALANKTKDWEANDVSFVGSLYNESHNLYDRLKDKLKEKNDTYTIGYLEGIMQSQQKIYGGNFLEQCLTDDMIARMEDAMKYQLEQDSFASTRYVYANYFLCRKITSLERIDLLTSLADSFSTYLYTFDKDALVGNVINKGPVDYYLTMPKIFQQSKINLNISLKSIKTGIPLRAWDIMGAGGFLLSNYQEDFLEFFEPDIDFVYYASKEELLDKVSFYLRHEKERMAIAHSGHEKVCMDHNYHVRLQQMLTIVETS